MSITPHFVETDSWISASHIPVADYVINPYVGCPHACRYCYACFMKRFRPHPEPWGEFLDIKTCQKPLNVRRLTGKRVMLSSVTDPYNPFEKKFRLTRQMLEAMAGHDIHVSILTKSDLVLRDLDVLKRLPSPQVAFSVNTTDDSFRALMDRASPIPRRLKALEVLHTHGIATALFVSPFFPYITDFQKIIQASRDFVPEYWFENLSLRAPFKTDILRCIQQRYPQLHERYVEIFIRKRPDYWIQTAQEIHDFCTREHIRYTHYFQHSEKRSESYPG